MAGDPVAIPLWLIIIIYTWSFIQFYMRCCQIQELYELQRRKLIDARNQADAELHRWYFE